MIKSITTSQSSLKKQNKKNEEDVTSMSDVYEVRIGNFIYDIKKD